MGKFRAHADRSCPKGRGHYCESGTVSAKNGRHGGQLAKTAERWNKAGVLVGGESRAQGKSRENSPPVAMSKRQRRHANGR